MDGNSHSRLTSTTHSIRSAGGYSSNSRTIVRLLEAFVVVQPGHVRISYRPGMATQEDS